MAVLLPSYSIVAVAIFLRFCNCKNTIFFQKVVGLDYFCFFAKSKTNKMMNKFTKAIAAIMLMMIGVSCNKPDEPTDNIGTLNGHDYVDLGLPSGTLWAICNIGADSPEKSGDYFAWGEIETKVTYNWVNYKFCNGANNQLTKYCNDSHWGYNEFTDTLCVLDEGDDIAMISWGSGWRMPSQQDWYELVSYCSHNWTNQNGVNGLVFTSPNGGNIFFPASGYYYENEFVNEDVIGYYWSNSINASSPIYSRGFNFSINDYYVGSMWRCYGVPVRPVRTEK